MVAFNPHGYEPIVFYQPNLGTLEREPARSRYVGCNGDRSFWRAQAGAALHVAESKSECLGFLHHALVRCYRDDDLFFVGVAVRPCQRSGHRREVLPRDGVVCAGAGRHGCIRDTDAAHAAADAPDRHDGLSRILGGLHSPVPYAEDAGTVVAISAGHPGDERIPAPAGDEHVAISENGRIARDRKICAAVRSGQVHRRGAGLSKGLIGRSIGLQPRDGETRLVVVQSHDDRAGVRIDGDVSCLGHGEIGQSAGREIRISRSVCQQADQEGAGTFRARHQQPPVRGFGH